MRPRVKKSLNTLLNEVFNGNFNDFRAYLAQGNVTDLVLRNRNLGSRNLALLSTALQGTQVTTVDLMGNGLGPQSAIDFAPHLKGTQVTTVYLGVNQIGDQGASDFAQHLKDTQVTTVNLADNQISPQGARNFAQRLQGTLVTTAYLGKVGPEAEIILSKALVKNNFRIHLAAPLMYASMHTNETTRQLTVNKKYENCSEEEQSKFVWEILQSVPTEVRFLIINKANQKTGLNIKKALTGFCMQREKRPVEERALLFEFKEKMPSQEKRETLDEEENGSLSKKLKNLRM